MDRKDLAGMSLDRVADIAGGCQAGSLNDQAAKAEFLRRQTMAQTDAAKSTKIAAWAAVAAAVAGLLATLPPLFR